MRVQYKCPNCNKWVGKTGVYNSGTYAHKCPHCKQKVQLHVTGSMVWRPDLACAVKNNH